MAEESTTPYLVEMEGASLEAVARLDFDGMLRHFAPDTVWEAAALGQTA